MPVYDKAPAPSQHYVSRKVAEKDLRTALLNDDDKPLTLLYGESGMGKTDLARRVITSLQEENTFVDGVFWVEFPEPMLGNSLWKLLCKINQSLQDTPQLAAGHLHTALWDELEQRKMLFVLDNLPDARPIHELLFGKAMSDHQDGHVVIRSRLRGALGKLSEGELKDLCFDLEIEYEDLPSSGKGNKARDLVDYFHRHNRISQLILQYRRLYPDQQLSRWIPGRCRILAISTWRITDLPLPCYEPELPFFCESEYLQLFKYHLDPDLYAHYRDLLPSIAQQNRYQPQLIDVAARELRDKKLLSKNVEQNRTPQTPVPAVTNPVALGSLAVTSSGESLHPITMYVSRAQIRGLWHDAQGDNENAVGR